MPAGIVELTAIELSESIRTRRISCVEVMEAYLSQIDRVNPRVNAIVSLQDRESLIRQSRERDDQLARGEYLGWMHGFPHAVKDLASTRGIPSTCGSPLLADFVPAVDAFFVERMRRSGAILIGKTNTPEFGLGSQTYNPVFGTTLNPYDLRKTCGGSSGGAAVAVATRMVPVADGSDMCGSLRNPAAYCNVFGFRPSAGRVPLGPSAEVFLQQLAYEGPMARTVSDLAMLLSVMAGPDTRAPLSLAEDPSAFAGPLRRDFDGAILGWLGNWGGYLPMQEGLLELCREGIAVFADLGCRLEDATVRFPPEKLWSTWLVLRQFLVGGTLHVFFADPAKRARMKPEAQLEVEGALKLSALDVHQASVARSAWYDAVLDLFARFDFLLAPSAQVFPFDATVHWPKEIDGRAMDTYHRWMEVVVPWTLCGCPVLSVPVGFGEDGLPMGVQIVGRPRADLSVLQLGRSYEEATGWVQKRPPPLAPDGS